MQRIAFFAFIGVIALLMAFTVQQSGKQNAIRSCNGQRVSAAISDSVMLASRR